MTLGADVPAIRRLLEPFLADAHARTQITLRLRATDAEAFAELVSALESEQTRRG